MTPPEANSKKARSPWSWVPTLYFAEGLPYIAVNTLSVVLYTDCGVPKGEMAFYTSLLNLPWVLKFIWSPFVDILRTKRWWIVSMQWLMAAMMALIAFALPVSFWFAATLGIFWISAFASATHDIAADGFYMEALDQNRQAYFVGIRSTFYRFATIFGNGVLVALAGWMDHLTGDKSHSWMIVFFLLAAIIGGAALWHTFKLPRPEVNDTRERKTARQIMAEFGESFRTFFAKPGIFLAIIFMLLYRLPEALMLKMVFPFMSDKVSDGGLGITKDEYGIAYGIVGVAGLLLGGIVGGFLAARDGLGRWMRPMAWAMSLTCLTFLLLSYLENPSFVMINVCIFVEQFGYGFGFSAYMLYLLYFSKGRYATSHYAICTGFMAASIMLPGMVAGRLQELLGYQNFFWLCIGCCAATILVASLVKFDPSFGKKRR